MILVQNPIAISSTQMVPKAGVLARALPFSQMLRVLVLHQLYLHPNLAFVGRVEQKVVVRYLSILQLRSNV